MDSGILKLCAFCGVTLTNKNISREHLWGDWLRDYVPRTFVRTEHMGTIRMVVVHEDGRTVSLEQVVRGKLDRPGDPHAQRLRIVCRTCNNGWMSVIQEQAKAHLVPYTRWEWPSLSPESIEPISAWACLFTMVLEFAHIDTMATTPEQRRALMQTGRPPDDWVVWAGRFKGTRWRGSFNHFGLGGLAWQTSSLEPPPSATALAPLHTAQSTAFCLGSLFLFTFSTRGPLQVDSDRLAAFAGIRRIWPNRHVAIEPPNITLDDVSADQVSRLCLPPASRPTVRAVWETR